MTESDCGGKRYVETEGLLKRFGENPTVLDFVQLYLTNEIFDFLVTETNLSATQFFF